jgi:hypothetical protein
LAVGPPGLLDGGEAAGGGGGVGDGGGGGEGDGGAGGVGDGGGGGDDEALCDDGPVQVYVLPKPGELTQSDVHCWLEDE